MHTRQVPPTVLLLVFFAVIFLTNLSLIMLGPLLVDLAHAFQPQRLP